VLKPTYHAGDIHQVGKIIDYDEKLNGKAGPNLEAVKPVKSSAKKEEPAS